MTEIRTFGPDDVPAVAAMFQRTFRERAVPAPASRDGIPGSIAGK